MTEKMTTGQQLIMLEELSQITGNQEKQIGLMLIVFILLKMMVEEMGTRLIVLKT